MTTKSQEQRIADAAAVALRRYPELTDRTIHSLAADMLEAADAPPKPSWPTDEHAIVENSHPVIREAIAYRDLYKRTYGFVTTNSTNAALFDALERAGL